MLNMHDVVINRDSYLVAVCEFLRTIWEMV